MDDRLRPVSDSSRKSPSSPGKRRMVDNERGKLRLISRGLPDSDEEEQQQVIINPPQVTNIPPKERRVLNLSASRKRKTVELNTGEQTVLVLPSPTTQIARQIDSIRLAGTPVYGSTTNRLPMLGLETTRSNIDQGDHQMSIVGTTGVYTTSTNSNQTSTETMDESERVIVHTGSNKRYQDHGISSRDNLIKPTSPHAVPPVGTNIEVMNDTVMMERYLQRPQHTLNMKRTIDEQDNEGDISDNNEMETISSRREKMTKYSHVSNSNKTTNPIKISTIVRSPTRDHTSTTNTLSPPKDKHAKHSSHPTPSPTTPMAQQSTPIISSSTNASFSPSSSQPQSNKVSNFSITELLAKDDNRSKSPKPTITQTFPAIPPAFLTLYYQQWYMQMLSNMNRFQGEASEADSGSVKVRQSSTSPLLVIPEKEKGNNSSSSPVRSVSSPINDTNSPYSVSSSSSSGPHKLNSPERETENNSENGSNNGQSEGRSQPFASICSSDSGKKKSGQEEENETDQRQNALLQVSEAHLAILPDEDGDTPLHLSIIQENIPLTFYLVRLICGVRMNLDIANNLRQTPLHLSVITRQPMLTQLLVQNGASVNFPDRRGNTCVHLAAQRKNVDVLQILSHATNPLPDFNCRNFAGLTPVHIATKEGSVDVLKFLFQMGANKNCADSCSGRTPLHYAVESQNFQMCNFLLENGCNVNAITFSGNTPLHVAAGRRLKEIVAVLMAYGANPAIANGEGDFPSDLPASLLMQRAKMNAR